MTTNNLWSTRADVAQRSLTHFYGTAEPQFLNNSYPNLPGGNETFNYWWLAHVVEARLDAYERTGDPEWLEAAITAHHNILSRNGTLFNDYFDDMLWYAIAILRLADATADSEYLAQAKAIWEHVRHFGWNDTFGDSLAWRKQQLYYKNTPANGPFAIVSSRLAERTNEKHYMDAALAAFEWINRTLRDPSNGFVEDGINREQDGRIDTQWRFTYNQGLYVGAAVELFRRTGDAGYLEKATRTALTAIDELATDGVFRAEGDGGDEGLFKGIYYRYAELLLHELSEDSSEFARIAKFIETSTDTLIESSLDGAWLLAGNDWTQLPMGTIAYSTELSAILALEARARLEARNLVNQS